MKRLVSVIMAILLTLSLVACGNGKDAADDKKEAFVKPKSYATVLLVTINPQFKLYLDDQNKVLAVEPVNDDAKSIAKNTEFGDELDKVIEKIVNKANDGGFVKQNATVDFKITENKNKEIKVENILNTVKDTAKNAFDKIDVKVEIKTSVAENSSNTNSTPSQPENNNSEPNQSEHTHSFSAATCTAPKTCSCGATEGKALGHSFKNGKCTNCGTADPNHVSLTSVSSKNGTWSAEFVNNEKYYSVKFTLTGSIKVGVGIGDPLSSMEQEVQDDIRKNKDNPDYKSSYVIYQGKEYWSARGSGSAFKPIEEKNNTITLTDAEEAAAQIVLTRTDENTLTVKSLTQTFKDKIEDIPVGTKLIFKAN